MNAKRLLAIFMLVAMMASVLVSCGDSGNNTNTPKDTTAETTAETVPEEPAYVYPELDYKKVTGKDELNILTASTNWGFYTDLDFDSMTGVDLDNAIYTRNRTLEDKFNFKMKVIYEDINEVQGKYQSETSTGGDAYDIGIIPANKMATFITDGVLQNLLDYDAFHFEEDYWDQSVMSKSLIGNGKTLNYCSSDFTLFGFDGTLIILFNADMLENLELDTPFDLVRNGEWTLDKMSEYMRACKNLNGDDNWTWNKANNCVYGMASWNQAMDAFLLGTGEDYIKLDEENYPRLAVQNDRFYTICTKLNSIFVDQPGDFLTLNKGVDDSYTAAFQAGRAGFITCELHITDAYRDMEDSYGLVPIPKYEASQEKYLNYRTTYVLLTTIPKGNIHPEAAATILDALAYTSQQEILPIYYKSRVQSKGLQSDENSIEMLDKYIAPNRIFDIGCVYGWTNDFTYALNREIAEGSGNASTLVGSYQSKIEQAIDTTMGLMQ